MKDAAKAVANGYAVKPQDGYFLYAAVGITLAGLAAVLLRRFFQIDAF